MPQYQGVWTLEQQAQAQSNQQWVTDPNFKNTTLLLQADGTGSGSQNQTFLDGSTNNFFITRNGNTTQGSFSPFSQAPGRWSNYFDGNASCDLAVASTAQFNWGTNDFCIEAFVYPQVVASARIINFGDGIFNFEINASGYLSYFQGTSYTASTGALSVSTWTHCVITRQSGTIRMFANGVLVYTNTNTTSKGTSTANIGSFPSGGDTLTGYISNLRVVNGNVPTAYQTSSTTVGSTIFFPPNSPLTAVSGSALLTCQSNYFVDNSGNSLTITVGAGTPSVQAFGPFAPALQWTPDVVGGSGYFDGTGDYLVVPSNANLSLGSFDFTIELWWYPTGFSADGEIFSMSSSGGTSRCYSMYTTSSNGKLEAYAGSGGGSWDIINALNMGTYVLNQWNHIAFTRSGSTFNTYLNGVRISTTTSSGTLGSANLGIGANNAGGGVIPASYMSARTIKGTALYTGSTYTIPTTPFSAVTNTNFLLGCTNAGIYDGKMANNLETVGNAQVATSPVKYGSGSMYFSGVSPYGYLKGNANLGQSVALAGDFTVECWVWLTADTSDNVIMDTRPGSNSGNYFLFYLWTSAGSTKPVVAWYTPAVGYIVNSGGAVPANAWTHIAVSRANGMMRSFINGVVQQTAANTTAYANPGAPYPNIGASYAGGGSDSFKGYIDDFRITNGVARYIANFTPPQQALPRQ